VIEGRAEQKTDADKFNLKLVFLTAFFDFTADF